MSLAEQIVDCPRGRGVCAALAEMCEDEVERAVLGVLYGGPGYSHDPDIALIEFEEVLSTIPAAKISEFPAEQTLQAVAAAVGSAHYWQPPDDDDLLYARPAVRAALLPIARVLTEMPHTRSWGEGVDLSRQYVVRYQLDDDEDPNRRPSNAVIDMNTWRARAIEEELGARRRRPLDPAAPYSGSWWSSPVFTGALQTTVAVEGTTDLRLGLVEDSLHCDRLLAWPVAIDGAPRVFEITGPARWSDLVSSYPLAVAAFRRHDWYRATGEVHDWFIPDWAAVAADYDAVHLTMWGYLTTAGWPYRPRNDCAPTTPAPIPPPSSRRLSSI